MKFAVRAPAILAACVAIAASLAACGTPPPPPIAALPPPPPIIQPPPPPPPVTLANGVIELASTYRAAALAASGIQPAFTDGPSVSRAVRLGSSFEQGQLQQGMVAYVAIAALQEPNFVASVRAFVNNRTVREDLARKIIENPDQVRAFENVDKAAGLAIAAIDQMGAQVMVSGRAVKQQAYDVQKEKWSKANIPDASQRLLDSKDLSTRRLLANVDDVSQLRQATSGAAATSLAGAPVQGPYSDAVTRGLAVAALAALGQAGDENFDAVVLPLLTDQQSGYCFNMAKLNLFQCLAVAKPYYEDIFCVGQHAMMDNGACMIRAANSPSPAFIEPPPPPRPEPKAKPKPKAVAKKPAPRKK